MISSNGIIDWAIPLRLPESKRYGTNRNEAATMHSLEANYRGRYGLSQHIRDMAVRYHDLTSSEQRTVRNALAALYWAWDEPSRPWTAWHTTTFKEGFTVQHAPLHWMIAHGHGCNDEASGHEAEGRAPEALTPQQTAAYIRLLSDLEQWKGVPFTRENGRIIQHKECPDASTACPGGRYTPLYVALREKDEAPTPPPEDEEMTPQERETLWALARITVGWGQVESEEIRDPEVMADRIKRLDRKNINLLLAHQRSNAALLRLQAAVEDLSLSSSLGPQDRETLARHMRAMATLIEEGDATDPLAEPKEDEDED